MRMMFLLLSLAFSAEPTNLIVNGDFEEPGEIGKVPKAWLRNGLVSTRDPHSGARCAVHTASPSNSWNMFDTGPEYFIAIKTNQHYRLSGFCRNDIPSGTIALGVRLIDNQKKTIAYQWKMVGANIQSWQEYVLDFATTSNAAWAAVYLKLGEDARYGEAYWDDLRLVESEETIPWFTGALNGIGTYYKNKSGFSENVFFDPTRQSFLTAEASALKYRIAFQKPTVGKRLLLSIRKRHEPEILAWQSSIDFVSNVTQMEIPLGIEKLKAGRFVVTADLMDGDRTLLHEASALAILPDPEFPKQLPPVRRSSVESGHFLVNGKPFAGTLFYHPDLTREHFTSMTRGFGENVRQLWAKKSSEAADVKENISDLRRSLDLCSETGSYGVVVLFHPWVFDPKKKLFRLDVLKEVVLALKDHPALLLWDLIDEPDGQQVSPEAVNQASALLREIDPNHAVWVNLCYQNRFADYINASDLASYDHYPFPSEPLSIMDRWNEQILSAGKNKPLLSILQTWSPSGVRLPSPDELRAETYLNVIRGMSLFFYFTWANPGEEGQMKNDLPTQSTVKELSAELSTLAPFLYATNEAVSIPALESSALRYCLRNVQGKKHLLVVNLLPSAHPPFTFPLPSFRPGASVEALFEDGRKLSLRQGSLTDQIPGFGVRLYKY